MKLKGLCGWSWAALAAYVCGLGPLLGPLRAVLGRSWGLCWRSWGALGAYVIDLGPLLGPMLAVLGRSWSLCWPSWGVLGPKWPVLSRSGRSWKGVRAEKWLRLASAVRPRNSESSETPKAGMDPNALKPSLDFFKRYTCYDMVPP